MKTLALALLFCACENPLDSLSQTAHAREKQMEDQAPEQECRQIHIVLNLDEGTIDTTYIPCE